MTARSKIIAAALASLVLAAGAYAVYRIGVMRGLSLSDAATQRAGAPMNAGDVDPTTGRRVLYWHDPMVPGRRFDEPGKSPFMNMMLVPVYEGENGGSSISVDPRVQQNLGIRIVEVIRATISPDIDAVGSIAFNERDQAVVQVRATAYLEKVHVRATLDRVAQAAPLAELYVPDWVAAQEEFLAVRRILGPDSDALVDAARQRMRQVGMTDEQIERVEQLEHVQASTTLRAPIAGVIVDLAARDGMTVMPGETLFRINGLATVWANAEVPESQSGLVFPGAAVRARSPAFPDTVFEGTVQAILPSVDASTRTMKARIELKNPDWRLAPGMFVNVTLSGPTTDALWVPSEALIQTGRRAVVMLAGADGTFQPAEVEAGIEHDGRTQITRGLTEGQRVVASGQFLIDSEANLRAMTSRTADPSAAPGASIEHTGEGTIEAIDVDSVTLSHGAIPSAQWGSMTMEFGLLREGNEPPLQQGQRVTFSFTLGADGKPRITRIQPAGGGPR